MHQSKSAAGAGYTSMSRTTATIPSVETPLAGEEGLYLAYIRSGYSG